VNTTYTNHHLSGTRLLLVLGVSGSARRMGDVQAKQQVTIELLEKSAEKHK
jgi:hypothetical protein